MAWSTDLAGDAMRQYGGAALRFFSRVFARLSVAKVAASLLLLLGVGLIANATWIHAKALLAQYLIADAWQHSLASGKAVKPWPWADTWPAGHLTVRKYGVDLYSLEGLGGNALAFGPGQLTLHSIAGGAPSYVLAGHRDTHFRFMKNLAVGDLLRFTDRWHRSATFRIDDLEIVDSRVQQLQPATDQRQLLLVTCYPFDAVTAGGPLRYVAYAVPVPQALSL